MFVHGLDRGVNRTHTIQQCLQIGGSCSTTSYTLTCGYYVIPNLVELYAPCLTNNSLDNSEKKNFARGASRCGIIARNLSS